MVIPKPLRNWAARYKPPKWETALCEAIGQAIEARDVYATSSAAHGNMILTAEFELPGEIHGRFESCPSRWLWGTVDIVAVLYPRDNRLTNLRPGSVLPLGDRAGAYQGEVTAFVRIAYGQIMSPNVSLFYVSTKFQREWRNVCGL